MYRSFIIATTLTIGMLGASVNADDRGSGTMGGGSGETGANERQGAAQAQPGDRRGTTMGRDQRQQGGETGGTGSTESGREDEESGGGTQHGDAPARNPATR